MKISGPCLAGCTLRGHHEATCETQDREVDPCRGCVPRPSEFGRLCAFCWQRAHSDLIDAPQLVAHLREMAEPHAGTKPPGDGRGMGDPAEGSILSGAVDAADEVHAALASWATLVLEEHPHGAQMAGPDQRGAWLTRYGATAGVSTSIPSRAQNGGPAIFDERVETAPVLDSDGRLIQYVTTVRRPDPPGEANPTARLVHWLLPMMGWASEQEWAGEMRLELGALIRTTLARWPMEDTRTRAVAGVLCTSCGRASLVYTPTSGFMLPFSVACTHPECGRVYSEAEYDGAIGRLAIERGYVA